MWGPGLGNHFLSAGDLLRLWFGFPNLGKSHFFQQNAHPSWRLQNPSLKFENKPSEATKQRVNPGGLVWDLTAAFRGVKWPENGSSDLWEAGVEIKMHFLSFHGISPLYQPVLPLSRRGYVSETTQTPVNQIIVQTAKPPRRKKWWTPIVSQYFRCGNYSWIRTGSWKNEQAVLDAESALVIAQSLSPVRLNILHSLIRIAKLVLCPTSAHAWP